MKRKATSQKTTESKSQPRHHRKLSQTERIAALEERMQRLEAEHTAPSAPTSPTARRNSPLDFLVALRDRQGSRYERDGNAGAIAYAGAARWGEADYQWCREHSVPELLEADWNKACKIFECLGSPARLLILRQLLHGPKDRHALQEALGGASSGQLYHHLRDLLASGLLVQQKRGTFELAATAVIPTMTAVAIALQLAATPNALSDLTDIETEV